MRPFLYIDYTLVTCMQPLKVGHMFVTNYTQYQCQPSSSVSLFTRYLGLFITVFSEPRPLSSIFTPQFYSCHQVISSRTDHNRYIKPLYNFWGSDKTRRVHAMIIKYKYLKSGRTDKKIKTTILANSWLLCGHCGPVTVYCLSTLNELRL